MLAFTALSRTRTRKKKKRSTRQSVESTQLIRGDPSVRSNSSPGSFLVSPRRHKWGGAQPGPRGVRWCWASADRDRGVPFFRAGLAETIRRAFRSE